jgi:glucokinase
MERYGFGIDLGGTTCKLGLFQVDGTLMEKWEIPTDTRENGKNVLPDIAASVEEKIRQHHISREQIIGAGIGVPGAVNNEGVVNRCINLGWGIVPVSKELSSLLSVPVYTANDANVAALGEAWKGSGNGYSSIAMITLGTGIGGGVVLDGQIINGFHGAAGELGHIVVNPEEQAACNCGNHGCIEQYASATGIVRQARKQLAESSVDSVLRKEQDLSAKSVFDAAKAGDVLAKKIAEEVCDMLGRVIGTICNVINPEAVIIGGGVSRAGDILLELVQEGFRNSVFHASRDTVIRLASLGNDAGIYGAMKLFLNKDN